MCVSVCKSFTLVDVDGTPQVRIDNGLGCIGCGHCMAVCPHDAITVMGRSMSPDCLIDLPQIAGGEWSERLENLLLARRSVREFTGQAVDRKIIDRVLRMAASAPMGIPPSNVSVTVVEGHERVQAFGADILKVFGEWRRFFNPVTLTLMAPFFSRAERVMFRDFILPVIEELTEARKKGLDYLFYSAPCVLLFHQSPYADPLDGTVACTYAMLAAHSLGLGTCMIGTVSYAIQRKKALKRTWGIPLENTVSLAMIMGHPGFAFRKALTRSFASIDFR